MTKDCRKLGEYIAHFRKHELRLNYDRECDQEVYGIVVQKDDGSYDFVKLLNKGKEVRVMWRW